MNIRRSEHFGDIMLISKQRSQIIVKVGSNQSELLLIKRIDFENIVESYMSICKNILRVSSYNYQKMLQLMQEKINKIKEEKIFRTLKLTKIMILYNL